MHPPRRVGSSRSSALIRGPAELLQAIPYLLGFHPQRSLVLVGLHEGMLVVTARLDLAETERGSLVGHTLAAIVRGGASTVIAAVYGDTAGRDALGMLPGRQLVEMILGEAAAVDCEVADVLLVVEGRWWSLVCTQPGCCPDEGRAVLAAPSEFAAAATVEGRVALPDRDAVEALLHPLPDEVRCALDPLIEQCEHAAVAAVLAGNGPRADRSVKRALFAAARESAQPQWTGIDDAGAARFGVALSAIPIRDAVWIAIDTGRLDGRALWRELARRLPGPYDAGPLFLFGWASWRAGDGTLAGIAAERAVGSDPDYTAADLLLAALAHGVDPRRLPKLRLARSA